MYLSALSNITAAIILQSLYCCQLEQVLLLATNRSDQLLLATRSYFTVFRCTAVIRPRNIARECEFIINVPDAAEECLSEINCE